MPLQGVKTLVVEDHPDSRDVIRKMLEYRGALVTVAADGEEALQRVAEDCPDLILCDLMMPRMDGYEVAQRVGRMPGCKHVRLVALTVLSEDEAYFRTWSAGFDAHVEKPVSLEKLDQIAAQFLLGRQEPAKRPSKRRRR